MMDVQFWMNQLNKAINKKQYAEAGAISARMAKDIKAEEEKPSIMFTDEKRAGLRSARERLETLAGAAAKQDQARAAVEFENAMNDFGSIYSNTVVYLLRHPEKSKEKGRALAPLGVTQARAYALALINEILLCPKDVSISMYTSEIERTQKFAQIVGYELTKLAQMQGREVKFNNYGQDNALCFRFTKEELDYLTKVAEKKGLPTNGSFPQFIDWVQNSEQYAKEFSGMHHAAPMVAELEDFVTRTRRGHSSTEKRWDVVLGFSHSWILDVLRMKYASNNVKAIIPSAGFVKIDGNKIFIDDRWYKYG